MTNLRYLPDAQARAGHVPAELYAVVQQAIAQQGGPAAQPVVIVQQQPQTRPYGLYVAAGLGGGVLAVAVLLAVAVVAVAVAIGVISCAVGWVALKSMANTQTRETRKGRR